MFEEENKLGFDDEIAVYVLIHTLLCLSDSYIAVYVWLIHNFPQKRKEPQIEGLPQTAINILKQYMYHIVVSILSLFIIEFCVYVLIYSFGIIALSIHLYICYNTYMYVCCFNNFTLAFDKEFSNPLVGHAVIASDYRAGGTWFDTRCCRSSWSTVVLTKDLSCRWEGKPRVMLGVQTLTLSTLSWIFL